MKRIHRLIGAIAITVLITGTVLVSLVGLRLVPNSVSEDYCIVCGLHRRETRTWPGAARIQLHETEASRRVDRLQLAPHHAHVFWLGGYDSSEWFGRSWQTCSGPGYPERDMLRRNDEDFATTVAALEAVTSRHPGQPPHLYRAEFWNLLFSPRPIAAPAATPPTVPAP